MNDYYIGVMTGNSMDAADAVLAHAENGDFKILAAASEPINDSLANRLRELAESSVIAVEQLLTAQNALTDVCATAVVKLCAKQAAAKTAKAIGCHGQTLAHRPSLQDGGATWQLLNGALLAEKTGLAVICDFRSRDIATGGEGAPLAPLFHRRYFAAYAPCDIVNIGGIANITHLDAGGDVRGHDTGPGMILMDGWHRRRHPGADTPYDADGVFADAGANNAELLRQLRKHPYFNRPPPKSCGREEFALPALAEHVGDDALKLINHLPPADVQATFLELTAQTVAAAVLSPRLFVCGGGAQNPALMRRLTEILAETSVQCSDAAGLPSQQMEAALFAWLAKCHLCGEALQTTTVTGGKPRIAGAYYPA